MEELFGNKTMWEVVTYLNRKGEGSASSISRELQIPLNLVQRQISKLDEARIISASRQGKSKVYSWNPQSPGLKHLRAWLQTAVRHASPTTEPNPADGSLLSVAQRLAQSESLYRQARELSPFKGYKPFVKTFNRMEDYEKWKKSQKHPWLI